ncbi:hypothetical protein C8J57DRAFT_1217679 [Mycena rebaudengoi]|nr:hypothetical protein C8J57DRAFT_1217679 [Mycena rebaudengoi]
MVHILALVLSALGAVSAAAAATPAPAAAVGFLIVDYQSQVFNLVNTNSANLTPVQGWPDQKPTASIWDLVDTATPNVYQIVNRGTGTSLSYSTAPTASSAIRAQIVGNKTPSLWRLDPAGGPIIETVSGLAVTSWPVGASFSNPLTLEQRNASDSHQIFKFAPVCYKKYVSMTLKIEASLHREHVGWHKLRSVNPIRNCIPRSRVYIEEKDLAPQLSYVVCWSRLHLCKSTALITILSSIPGSNLCRYTAACPLNLAERLSDERARWHTGMEAEGLIR